MNDMLSRVKMRPFHDDDVCFAERPGPPPHIEVASDREAMKMALTEYIIRLMFEHGPVKWMRPYAELLWDAEQDAKKEFFNAPINRK